MKTMLNVQRSFLTHFNFRGTYLYVLFFFSGIPALFYQLVWQRSLFAIYGISIEAITMVIAAFMLGLGLGSLLGGWLSEKIRNHLLKLFGVGELLIGIFGFLSLHVFAWVGVVTLHVTNGEILLITFLLVCIPTVVMGATLPILVAYNTRNQTNIGNNVGNLYFANTFGSAIACLIAAFWAMNTLGQQGVVNAAAMINIIIGLGALFLATRPQSISDHKINSDPVFTKTKLKFTASILLAMITGYVALSYEILWARIYAFASANSAPVYVLFLAAYLMGLAFGALISRSFCTSKVKIIFLIILILSCLMGFMSLPIIVFAQSHGNLIASFIWIQLSTSLFGFSLPLLSYCAIDSNADSGKKLSYLYLANIIGATVGVLITGLVLTQYFVVQNISLLLSYASLLLIVIFLCNIHASLKTLFYGVLGCLLLAWAMWLVTPQLYNQFYARLQTKVINEPHENFKYIIENKAGIITINSNDTVFGNGIYDGVVNINLMQDPNLIVRAYSISAFHPHPTDVLMIGLSSGAWAQVIANNPYVKHLTIIEINPGYLKLISHYPEVLSLLSNPKVHIIIADGRRWLLQNPNQKFDMIVMNTTWNWREYASNVLSSNFLQMTRDALKSGGILYYNTTCSSQVMRTGLETFPYGLRFTDLLIVSDSPIYLDRERWKTVLINYTIDGKKILNLQNSAGQQKLYQLLSLLNMQQDKHHWYSIEPREAILKRLKTNKLVTDNNMGTEWRP